MSPLPYSCQNWYYETKTFAKWWTEKWFLINLMIDMILITTTFQSYFHWPLHCQVWIAYAYTLPIFRLNYFSLTKCVNTNNLSDICFRYFFHSVLFNFLVCRCFKYWITYIYIFLSFMYCTISVSLVLPFHKSHENIFLCIHLIFSLKTNILFRVLM